MGGNDNEQGEGVGATRPFPPLTDEELDAIGVTGTIPPDEAIDPIGMTRDFPPVSDSAIIEPIGPTRDFPVTSGDSLIEPVELTGELPSIRPESQIETAEEAAASSGAWRDFELDTGPRHTSISMNKPDPDVENPTALVVVDTPIDAFQAGKAALADLQKEAPDLVYLDCWYSGMDALSFLRLGERSRPTLASTTIVCIPDDAGEELLELLGEAGVASVLRKDWTAVDLDEALQQARLPELPDESLGSERSFLELAAKLHPGAEVLEPVAMDLPSAEPEASLEPGTLIDRRYRVIRFVGRGATSNVYAVEDRELGETVALKLLTRDTDASATARERFRQEMRICRRIVHPTVVRSFEFGAWEGRLYFTMELLEGEPLRRLLLRNRWEPVPIKLGLGWMAGVAHGLAEAHKVDVVHRDIKPENLFLLRETGELKIMDFGIATMPVGSGPQEVEGMILGTPAYLSPEQVRGEARLTPASDVFSLGLVAWELFGGRHPFYRKNQTDLMRALVNDEAPKLRTASKKAPRRLETLLDRMLQKVPRRRPKNAGVVAEEFDRLLGR